MVSVAFADAAGVDVDLVIERIEAGHDFGYVVTVELVPDCKLDVSHFLDR